MTIEITEFNRNSTRLRPSRILLWFIAGMLLIWLFKVLFGPIPLTPKQQYDGAKECIEKGEIPYVLEDYVRCKRY